MTKKEEKTVSPLSYILSYYALPNVLHLDVQLRPTTMILTFSTTTTTTSTIRRLWRVLDCCFSRGWGVCSTVAFVLL